jgi:hypothetical protein
MADKSPEFESLDAVAIRLGIPMAWLRREVEAGRIPHLDCGARRLFNADEVRKSLLQRIAASAPKGSATDSEVAQ